MGNVINLPQNITTLATSFSRFPHDLDVLVVRKEGYENSHRELRVRRSVVLRALLWLKHHNKCYQNIQVDHAVVRQLPTDGDLTGLCTVEDTIFDEQQKQPVNDETPMTLAHLCQLQPEISLSRKVLEILYWSVCH